MNRTAIWIVTGLLSAGSLLVAATLWLKPSEQIAPALGRLWPEQDRLPITQIDHSVFDELLGRYVNQDGMVNYQAWRMSADDRHRLQQYLENLSRAALSSDDKPSDQLAFWINAYNAVTLEGILQVYPTTTIRNHTASVSGYNIWKDLPLIVGTDRYSLDDIEHNVLRKMKEPRIHFAIVCASIGCPPLRNEAYRGERIEEQLSENTRHFFSLPQNFRIGKQDTLLVSSILDWFGDDFGANQEARFTFLQRYLPESLRTLATDPQTKVVFLDYNWALNEQFR